MTEVNLTALTTEALNKSDVLWLRADGRDRATWFATGEDPLAGQVLVVSGGPEADLGELPEQVEILLRSKGSGGRLLTLRARAEAITPASPAWEPAARALLGERLNAPAGLVDTWRTDSTLWALTPFGAPTQDPGRPGAKATTRVAGRITTGEGGTRPRRPWHLGGRSRS
ncbi:MAG: hypothetical protein ACTMHL_08230 [Janibacter sp.]